MIEIRETYKKATSAIEQLMRDHRFKKANNDRNAEIDLTAQIMKCSGSLNIAKNDFEAAIREQSVNIKNGKAMHQDTIIQEQVLWDAALGYMLVREAAYSVETVHTYNSVAHANEMLQTAMNQIIGKKKWKLSIPFVNSKDRSEYAYLTSEQAIQQKEELLNSFFEDLKENGDIEKCILDAEDPAVTKGKRSANAGGERSTVPKSKVDEFLDGSPAETPKPSEEEVKSWRNG